MKTSRRNPIEEPSIGSIVRVCYQAVKVHDPKPARIGDPCQVIARVGPNTFHLRREWPSGSALNWVERVTSWVNVPQAQEVAS